jgi:hypothetical protein
MYERRLEHSLYKTLAELQRLRLLRTTILSEAEGSSPLEATPSPSPAHAEKAPSHRPNPPSTHPPFYSSTRPTDCAKQTQSAKSKTDRKHLAASRLRPNTPAAPTAEQTQSHRSKDLQRRGRYPKNRCENATRRLIVETEAPPARKTARRDSTTPITKGNLA